MSFSESSPTPLSERSPFLARSLTKTQQALLTEAEQASRDPKVQKLLLTRPETDDELWWWVRRVLNVSIPREAVCTDRGHVAPFKAFADAYFGRYGTTIWKGSRGLAGKTVLLAALSQTEAITLGAGITLLGGSGEQSERVHEYMAGAHGGFRKSFWASPYAPRQLLKSNPSARKTRLRNGGWINALMASQKSVRGPHPQRLRGDEIDEMDVKIWNAAKGQPMEVEGIREQTVGSSTHQNAAGTMTAELLLAAERGWPVYEWCYKEALIGVEGGWLTQAQVDRKRADVPKTMWEIEYELQEPAVEGRAIETDRVQEMFDPKLGTFPCSLGDRLIFEEPQENGTYAAGADWGKRRDKTFLWILRTDVSPMKTVAVFHLARQPWPVMIGKYNDLVRTYGNCPAAHDATGIGDVIADYLEVQATGIWMTGKPRSDLFAQYIVGIENEEIKAPRLNYPFQEHKTVTWDDLRGAGHPPDSFVAGAMAYHAATYLSASVFR